MTEDDKAPEERQQRPKRRKRAAPTIDLTATEVPAQAAAPSDPPQPEPAQAEPPPSGAHEPPRHASFGAAATSIAAGIAGAVIAIAVLAALWAAGVLPAATQSNGESAQIAALQKQIKDMQRGPAPATDNKAIQALHQSVLKLESDIAKLPRGDVNMAARLTAIDKAMNALNVSIGSVAKRADDLAGKVEQTQKTAGQAQQNAAAAQKAVADLRDSVQSAAKQASGAADPAHVAALQKKLDDLQAQVGGLDRSLKGMGETIGKSASADKAARLALSALVLRAAVVSGRPYKSELAQAKALGAKAQQMAPLAPFADTGLPSKQALALRLRELMPALVKASGAQQAPANFLSRLEANAGKLVRVSPLNAPQGDTPVDVLARLEVDAAHAEITAALADLDKLPAKARKPATRLGQPG